jgi:hypothetical protein
MKVNVKNMQAIATKNGSAVYNIHQGIWAGM